MCTKSDEIIANLEAIGEREAVVLCENRGGGEARPDESRVLYFPGSGGGVPERRSCAGIQGAAFTFAGMWY